MGYKRPIICFSPMKQFIFYPTMIGKQYLDETDMKWKSRDDIMAEISEEEGKISEKLGPIGCAPKGTTFGTLDGALGGPLTQPIGFTGLTFENSLAGIFDEAKHLLLSKHADYGPKNIALAPGGAINGLRVRMHDKLARINHLTEKGLSIRNESLRDTFMDLANYALIGVMVIDDLWPKE